MAFISMHHDAPIHGAPRGLNLQLPPVAWTRVAALGACAAFWVGVALIVAAYVS